MPFPKRYAAAFKENFNFVGLTTAIAVSAATLNPLPLLVGLVAEAAYLLFVPDSRWYDVRLSKRYDADVERRRQQLEDEVIPTLRQSMQARFARLEETRAEIVAQPVAEQNWFREVVRKLDYLLEKFLLFASKEAQFRSYLQSLLDEVRGGGTRSSAHGASDHDRSQWDDRLARRGGPNTGRTPPVRPAAVPAGGERMVPGGENRWVQQAIGEVQAHYESEMGGLREGIESESDLNTKGVMEKRLDVLHRRQEFAVKIGKILANLNHQLELLEDTFGLINDEIRARSPEQILSDIEEVVWQTDTMTRVLDEVGPFEQLIGRSS